MGVTAKILMKSSVSSSACDQRILQRRSREVLTAAVVDVYGVEVRSKKKIQCPSCKGTVLRKNLT